MTVDINKVICSTKPMTIQDHILSQQAMVGNWTSIAAYILRRTNLTQEEVLDLDDEDAVAIVDKIKAAIVSGRQLQDIAKGMDLG